MRLLQFLKFLRSNKISSDSVDPDEYVPLLWEDDYCQVEIVPEENKAFINEQSTEITGLIDKSRSKFDFAGSFSRGSMPITTLSKKITVNYLENKLTSFNIPKIEHIRYDSTKIINCKTSKIKAYGSSSFTIFFDLDELGFIKNIWLSLGLIVEVKVFHTLQSFLHSLGEIDGFVLIDWNSLELLNLKDEHQIQKYLMHMFK